LSARLFVAAELPEEVVDALVRWRPRGDALRAIAPESLHVTLAFLGWRDEADIDILGGLLDGLARPVGGLSVGGARWLPLRRPRVLAVELDDADGALAGLQRDVADRVGEAVGWEPEKRPFLAHVTVARVRGRARVDDPGDPPALGPFAAPALTLFRSHLGPAGSRYEALARARLGSG
jgi:RNA 2',3'-cyclic 3'-phosphodiesterase